MLGHPDSCPNHSTLKTAELNNDRKFRFLSQVTRPDYRIVSASEDLVKSKEEQYWGKEPISLEKGTIGNGTEMVNQATNPAPTLLNGSIDDVNVTLDSAVIAPITPIAPDEDCKTAVNSGDGCYEIAPPSSKVSPDDEVILLAADTLSPGCSSINQTAESNDYCLSPLKIEYLRLSPQQSLDGDLDFDGISVSSFLSESEKSPPNSCSYTTGQKVCGVRPVDMPLDVETNPFRQYFVHENSDLQEQGSSVISHPSPLQNCYPDEEEEEQPAIHSLDGSGTSRSYASDAQHLLENTVSMLERELHRAHARIKDAEKKCEMQANDVESLRYEMKWKDDRINQLQEALRDLEDKVQDLQK